MSEIVLFFSELPHYKLVELSDFEKTKFRMKEELTSVLKQTQNLPNADKMATLKQQADQLLKMLKIDIVKGVSVVDKGYGQRLENISSEIGDFKTRTGR